jgi:hypothetical protein
MATESSPATLVRAFKLADEYAKDQVALDILEDLGLSGVAHLFQRSYQKLFDFPTMPPTSMH